MKIDIKKRRFPLKLALTLPMVILILLITSMSIVQFNRYNTKISDDVSIKISRYIQSDIESHLEHYLGDMKNTLILNTSLAKSDNFNLDSEKKLGWYLLDQTKVNDGIDFSYYANEFGGIVSSGKVDEVDSIAYTEGMVSASFDVYDASSSELNLIKKIKDFDPKSKEWYENASDKTVYWSNIYYGAQNPVLGISASKAYYDENGKKLGVFGVDFLLNELSLFLSRSKITKNSLHALVESNGEIIGLSNNEKPFVELDGKEVRLSVSRYSNENLISAYEYIYLNEDNFEDVTYLYRNRDYINVSKFKLDNVEWFIISVIPKEDLLVSIKEINFEYYLIMFVIVTMSIFVVKKMVERSLVSLIEVIDKLNDVGKGEFGTQLPNEGSDIVGRLIGAFNKMSRSTEEYESKLKTKNKELTSLNENLEDLVLERTKELIYISVTDGLTGLKNHRESIRQLNDKILKYEQEKIDFSVIMLDVDNFKNVNDKYGHTTGDKVLKRIANIIIKKCGISHFAGRYGGEEFLIITSNVTIKEAVEFADDIRREISESENVDIEEVLTISAGVAAYEDGMNLSIIDEADKLLYKAKRNGKNCIEY